MLAESPEELNAMIEVVRSFCDTWRIEINSAKSQMMEVHPRGVCRKAEGYYWLKGNRGGLASDVDARILIKHFSQYGVVVKAVVMLDRATNRSRGFGRSAVPAKSTRYAPSVSDSS
eukprot:g20045.t1